MSQSPHDLRPILSPRMRWAVCVLAWIAFGLSIYLSWSSLSHAPVVGCSGGENVDCDSVISSSWSKWLGLPVAIGGLACYATLASLTLLLGTRNRVAQRWISSIVLMLSVVAGGAGLWFIALQLFVLEKICPFCMGVHACGMTLAALVTGAMVLRPLLASLRSGGSRSNHAVSRQILALQSALPGASPLRSPPTRGASGPSIGLALGGAVMALALLIGGQVFFPSETAVVQEIALGESIDLDAADESSTDEAAAKEPAAGEQDTVVVSEDGGVGVQAPEPSSQVDEPAVFIADSEPVEMPIPEVVTNDPPVAEARANAADRATDVVTDEVDKSPDVDPAADLFALMTGEASAADEPPVVAEPITMLPAAQIARSQPVVPAASVDGDRHVTTAQLSSATEAPSADAGPRERVVEFLDGRLKLDMYKHPVLGSPDAPHVILELMSYECNHCRRMHRMVEKGLERYNGQVAVVVMVVPLEMGCNKYITDSKYSHRGSCTTSRLAVGVAMVDRTVFPEFHGWLLANPDKGPSPEEAVAHAYQLVDRARLRELTQGDAVDQQLRGYVELYVKLKNISENSGRPFGLPVQIAGSTLMSGDPIGPEHMYRMWEEGLRLQPPSAR